MIIWYFKTDFSIVMEYIAQSRRWRKEISCMSSKLEMAFCIWFCPMCCVVGCLCQQVSCCRLDGADSSHRKAAVCQAAEGQQSRRPLLQACSAVGETVPASHCTLHVGWGGAVLGLSYSDYSLSWSLINRLARNSQLEKLCQHLLALCTWSLFNSDPFAPSYVWTRVQMTPI